MPMLSELIGLHHRTTPIGIVIDEADQTFALAEEAIRYYHGYAHLEVERIFERLGIKDSEALWSYDSRLKQVESMSDGDINTALADAEVTESGVLDWLKARSFKTNDNDDKLFDIWLSHSEWAIIKPLFYLYVERENALHLEASRVLGVDVYGRSVSEVQGEISGYHDGMHTKAFYYPVFTV